MSDPMPPAVDDDLKARVLDQLLALRSAKGVLTPQKLARYPALIEVMGGGDLLDAFMAFRRELRRYIESANRNERAAALSIYAKDEHVGERLQYAANRLSDAGVGEQRTARRWSDEGMPALAEDLVYMAEVQGRLGRELLHIELQITEEFALAVSIDQMVLEHLPVKAPEVTLWAMSSSGEPDELSLDLARYPATGSEKRLSHDQTTDQVGARAARPHHARAQPCAGRDRTRCPHAHDQLRSSSEGPAWSGRDPVGLPDSGRHRAIQGRVVGPAQCRSSLPCLTARAREQTFVRTFESMVKRHQHACRHKRKTSCGTEEVGPHPTPDTFLMIREVSGVFPIIRHLRYTIYREHYSSMKGTPPVETPQATAPHSEQKD